MRITERRLRKIISDELLREAVRASNPGKRYDDRRSGRTKVYNVYELSHDRMSRKLIDVIEAQDDPDALRQFSRVYGRRGNLALVNDETREQVNEARHTRYNPEHRTWRGRSYKRGGERVRDMREKMINDAGEHTSRYASARDDDYDVLWHDEVAKRELLKLFRDASDHPEDYTWTITADGYRGDHHDWASLRWDGVEWTIE